MLSAKKNLSLKILYPFLRGDIIFRAISIYFVGCGLGGRAMYMERNRRTRFREGVGLEGVGKAGGGRDAGKWGWNVVHPCGRNQVLNLIFYYYKQ